MKTTVLPLLLACCLLAACGSDDDGGDRTPTATLTATRVPTATPTPNPLAQACVDAGGSVEVGSCCASASDFVSTCGIGACGCGPEASRQIALCSCPVDTCWDGGTCRGTSHATPTPTPNPAAQACRDAGGTVSSALCCGSVGDFRDTCGPPGACGCAPSASHEVAVCECPNAGDCWNGSACVPDIEL